jgi:transposase
VYKLCETIVQKLISDDESKRIIHKSKTETLSPRDQETFRLYFDEGLSHDEVAKKLRISKSTTNRTFKKHGWKGRVGRQSVTEHDEDIHKIYFQDGLLIREVSDRLGVSYALIAHAFERNGWKARPSRSYKPINEEKAYKLYYEDDLSLKEVSKRLNVPECSVKHAFDELGWELRSGGGYGRQVLVNVGMEFPQIHGVTVTSEEQLEEIINNEFPRIKQYPNFPELLERTKLRLQFAQNIVAREKVSTEVLSKFAKSTGVSECSVRDWTIRNVFTRLENILMDAYSIQEAKKWLEEMNQKLSGVTNIQIMDQRLNQLYLGVEIRNLPGYKQRVLNAKNFFQFLDIMSEGGSVTTFAEDLGVNASSISRWLKQNRIPKLIRMAMQVPLEETRLGWKWLPLTMGNGRKMSRFIQVPEKISTYQKLRDVLSQISPIDRSNMHSWEKQLGPISQEDALMYVVGLALSDGTFRTKKISNRLTISLGRKYNWSLLVLNATRYYFGLLGVNTNDIVEIDRPYKYGEETRISHQYLLRFSSPFVTWMRKSLLGVRKDQVKSRDGIDADWVLRMPEHLRVSFLQGIADGDGYASSGGEIIGISTKNHQHFYNSLLHSLGIHSTIQKHSVDIRRKNSIFRCSELGFFRYASTRENEVESLAQMKKSLRAGIMGDKEKELIVCLHREGKSWIDIRLELWRQMGISRSPRVIKQSAETDGLV